MDNSFDNIFFPLGIIFLQMNQHVFKIAMFSVNNLDLSFDMCRL